MDDDHVAGEIRPDADPGPPIFKIIRRLGGGRYGEEKSNCDHYSYKLDEKWSRVTCADCGECLEAFDVLLRNGEWEERWRADTRAKKDAERSLLRASLRRLKRLRDTTTDEQIEIQVILDRYDVPLSELQELDHRVDSAVRDRKMERRMEKDRKALEAI